MWQRRYLEVGISWENGDDVYHIDSVYFYHEPHSHWGPEIWDIDLHRATKEDLGSGAKFVVTQTDNLPDPIWNQLSDYVWNQYQAEKNGEEYV